jgi:hypothetical protein
MLTQSVRQHPCRLVNDNAVIVFVQNRQVNLVDTTKFSLIIVYGYCVLCTQLIAGFGWLTIYRYPVLFAKFLDEGSAEARHTRRNKHIQALASLVLAN